MNLYKFFVLFLLLTLGAHASEKTGASHELDWARAEAAAQLRGILSQELTQAIGINEFALKVELTVNIESLNKSRKQTKQASDTEGMELPGFFTKEQPAEEVITHFTKEDVLHNISKIKVEIIHYEENYSKDFISSALSRIIRFNLTYLNENKIEIITTLEASPHKIKAQKKEKEKEKAKEDILLEALKRPLNVNVKESQFQKYWNENFRTILLSLAALVLVLGVLFVLSFRGSLGSLSETIKNKSFAAGSAPSAKNGSSNLEKSSHPSLNNDGDSFESYLAASRHLAEMVSQEPKVFNEVLLLKLMVEDFIALAVIVDVLPKEKRDTFLANMDHDKKERFNAFLVSEGHFALSDEVHLKQVAIKTIKLIKIAGLSPADLYVMVTTDLISSLNLAQLGELMGLSGKKEKIFVFDMLEPGVIASLIQRELLPIGDFTDDEVKLSKSEVLDLLIKATNVRKIKSDHTRTGKFEIIYGNLAPHQAEIFADSVGLHASLRFEFLFSKFKQPALQYIQALHFDAMVLLFPLLTTQMREDVIAQMPELLVERLKLAKTVVNQESLKIKGDFYFHLRSLIQSEHDARDNAGGGPLRIAA